MLPAGDVLIVGTGQSGCQIAEDLHLAGRRVHLCVGSSAHRSRRYRGRDVVDWLEDMGYYRMPVHDHPMKEKVRGKANHYVTGRDGGRDIDLRNSPAKACSSMGASPTCKTTRCTSPQISGPTWIKPTRWPMGIKTAIDAYIEANGVEAPTEARYQPVWAPEGEVRSRDLASPLVGYGYLEHGISN